MENEKLELLNQELIGENEKLKRELKEKNK